MTTISKTENFSLNSRPAVFLKDEPLKRYHELFKDRVYEYEAQIKTPKGEKQLKFSVPLNPFLDKCRVALGKGIFVRGGAVHEVLTGSKKELADLDLVLEIEGPHEKEDPDRFWSRIDRVVLNALAELSNIWFRTSKSDFSIYSQGRSKWLSLKADDYNKFAGFIFLLHGALRRTRVHEEVNQFTLYTLPTSYKGRKQPIDLLVCLKTQNPCSNSSTSLQLDLTPAITGKGEPSLRTVGGYNLEKALLLKEQRKFTAEIDQLKTMRKALLCYCHTLIKGESPVEHQLERIEQVSWQVFLEECRQPFPPIAETLKDYLRDHYSYDEQGKLYFLLNLYAFFSRWEKTLEVEEKQAIEEMFLKEIYAAAKLPMPDRADARADVKTVQAYLFLQARQKTFLCKDQYVLLETVAGGFLLLASPISSLSVLAERFEAKTDRYPLLQRVAAETRDDLLALFQSQIKKKVHPLLRPFEEHSSPQEVAEALLNTLKNPRLSLPPNLEHSIETLVLQLISSHYVSLAQQLLNWVLQQPTLPNRLELLKTAFKELFSHSKRTAAVLCQQFFDRKEEALLEFLPSLVSGEEEAKKMADLLLPIVRKGVFKAENHQALLNAIAALAPQSKEWEALAQYLPDCPAVVAWLSKRKEPAPNKETAPKEKAPPPKVVALEEKKEEPPKKKASPPKVVAVEEKKEDSPQQLGVALFEKRKFKEALAQFQRIEHPTSKNYNFMAKCHAELGDKKQGCTLLKAAIALDSDDSDKHRLWINLSTLYFLQGEKHRALKTAEQACQKFPKNEEVLAYLSTLYQKEIAIEPNETLRRGYLQKMVTFYEQCTLMSPNNAMWQNNYGYACLELGQLSTASKALERANKLDPHNPDILRNIRKCELLQLVVPKTDRLVPK